MPDFPWEAFMQAAQARNKNKMAGPELIGQGLATAGDIYGKYQQKKKLNQTLSNIPELAPLSGLSPELIGQLGPSLLKSKNQKPTVSLFRNTKTNQTSMEPQGGADWKEESGLSPAQRQAAMNSGIGAQARTQWAESIKQRTDNAVVNSIYSNLNSLNQSSGGVLGQAAQIQYRAQRGEHLLNTPGIANDKLVYGLVKADLASIAQGGSPTIAAQAEASLPTFKETVNGLLRRITAEPQSIDQPQIRQQLRKIFQVMNDSAGSIIQQNTQGVRALYENSGWVKENPKAFEQAIQYLGQGIKPFDSSKLPPLGNAPQIPPTWDNTSPVGDQ